MAKNKFEYINMINIIIMHIFLLPYELIVHCVTMTPRIADLVHFSSTCKYATTVISNDYYIRNKLLHAKLQLGVNKSIRGIVIYEENPLAGHIKYIFVRNKFVSYQSIHFAVVRGRPPNTYLKIHRYHYCSKHILDDVNLLFGKCQCDKLRYYAKGKNVCKRIIDAMPNVSIFILPTPKYIFYNTSYI